MDVALKLRYPKLKGLERKIYVKSVRIAWNSRMSRRCVPTAALAVGLTLSSRMDNSLELYRGRGTLSTTVNSVLMGSNTTNSCTVQTDLQNPIKKDAPSVTGLALSFGSGAATNPICGRGQRDNLLEDKNR